MMDVLILLMAVTLLLVAFAYSRLVGAIKQLREDLGDKMITGSISSLTSSIDQPHFQALVEQINRVFVHTEQTERQVFQQRDALIQSMHNVSHDLRTPITVALGYVQQVERDPDLKPDSKQKLHYINQQLKVTNERLSLLSDYQKLLEDNFKPTHEILDMSEWLPQQLFQYQQVLEGREIEVRLDLTPNVYMTSDEQLLARMIQNLIGNTLVHGERFIHVLLTQTEENIILSIENGISREIEHIERLTQRFYRENMAKSQVSSGLGLYITEQFANLLGADLQLEADQERFRAKLVWRVR